MADIDSVKHIALAQVVFRFADEKEQNLQLEANTRLIAAAPQILASLEHMVNVCPAIDSNGEEAHAKAQEAIAAARGQA